MLKLVATQTPHEMRYCTLCNRRRKEITVDSFGGLNESMKLGEAKHIVSRYYKNLKFYTKTFKNMNISRTLSDPNDHNLSVFKL